MSKNTVSDSWHLHELRHAWRNRSAAKTPCFFSETSGWTSLGGYQRWWDVGIRKRTWPFPVVCQALSSGILAPFLPRVNRREKSRSLFFPLPLQWFHWSGFKTLFHFRGGTGLKKKLWAKLWFLCTCYEDIALCVLSGRHLVYIPPLLLSVWTKVMSGKWQTTDVCKKRELK